MRKERKRSFSRRTISKVVTTFAMSAVVCAASFATALANTVSTIVTDGDQMYTFSMESTDLDEIIKKAEEMGLAPLGSNDICERVGNTTAVNVRRGVNLTLDEAGSISEFIAFKGDTIENALADNSIILKEKDEISPARDSVMTADTKVKIARYCTVTVFADGQEQQVSLVGATVQEAIEQTGILIGEDDTVNYAMDKPLFDNMRIRIGRVITVNITADGETKPYKLSADNVENAIKKAGIALGEDDIVSPPKNQKVLEGMEIAIQRVETKEETRTEEIAFQSTEEADSNSYPENGYVKVEGKNGQKEVKVKQFYIDKNLDHEEVISEKVLTEPVNKIVVIGTKQRPKASPPPVSNSSDKGFSYSQKFTGSASAYADYGYTASGSYTASGLVAVNPSVIPYGTKLYIETSGGYSGYYTAADTGGALQSGRILVDIWMPSTQDCLNFGVQSATVYVLD